MCKNSLCWIHRRRMRNLISWTRYAFVVLAANVYDNCVLLISLEVAIGRMKSSKRILMVLMAYSHWHHYNNYKSITCADSHRNIVHSEIKQSMSVPPSFEYVLQRDCDVRNNCPTYMSKWNIKNINHFRCKPMQSTIEREIKCELDKSERSIISLMKRLFELFSFVW